MVPRIHILCHLFYPELGEKLLKEFSYFDRARTRLFINVQGRSEAHQHLIKKIRMSYPQAYMLTAPSKGRDIGGKLSLINLSILLQADAEYSLIIHDKKSTYTPGGEQWRDELFKIISPKYVNKVFRVFEKHADVGIVCSANYIQNEYDERSANFLTRNNQQIGESLKKYKIETHDYNFVAGNIFWIRTPLLGTFFKNRSIPRIKAELEDGNVLDAEKGTFIHAWERIMSWIATSNNQRIYGI